MTPTKLRVRVTRPVSSDPPIVPRLHVGPGEYDAIIHDPYGAVAVVLPGGKALGVKPHEFEFIAENVAELVADITALRAALDGLRDAVYSSQRPHECPGFDCATCTPNSALYEAAEVLAATAPRVLNGEVAS